ncbi:hypothetical protein B5S28_g3540 [[Candida] boidinii]|uniref:Unnamed protein product n=1 Tax=Candida boidinii TaxID=5477 RepID=A0ACB5TW77_CANBO|nr:hypothetical protein B5S28_g3540 [[Candida] boidinii]OWB73846.1 hypothetical protein B5S31_g3610 [[Candida] boidinii]OWB79982.1 hypothetical protein B5S32_g4225 [[Candida] boidinii]GME96370.1 unnamed protein product [[Candida] boidinii]
MANDDVTSNVLGTIGTVCWCIQLTPQIYTNWKTKDTEGFPPIFMFLWAASGVPFGIYFMMSDSYIPMQVQPQMFTFLCTLAWIQSMYYPPNPVPKKKIIIYASSFVLISLALELGFILWLKPVYKNGTTWPSLIFGILASIILAAGLLPPYFELFKRQGRVVGINFLFLFLDSCGAIFSMSSVLVGKIDIMGMILYAIILAMEIGIFLSQGIWWIRFRWRKKIVSDEEEDNDGIHGGGEEDTSNDLVIDSNTSENNPQFTKIENNDDVDEDDDDDDEKDITRKYEKSAVDIETHDIEENNFKNIK